MLLEYALLLPICSYMHFCCFSHRNLPTIMTWVGAQKPGIDGVNIITSDFVELVDFASTVISLNNLLLPDRSGT